MSGFQAKGASETVGVVNIHVATEAPSDQLAVMLNQFVPSLMI